MTFTDHARIETAYADASDDLELAMALLRPGMEVSDDCA